MKVKDRHFSLPSRLGPATPMVIVLCVAALIGSVSTLFIQREITTMIVMCTIVVGLYSFSGTTGILSFGHTAFVLIGAYGAFLVSVAPTQKRFLVSQLPEWLQNLYLPQPIAVIVCGLLAAVVAAVVSVPISRLAGISAALALFTVLLSLNTVATNWDAVTRGTLGVFGVPRKTTLLVALIYAVIAVVTTLAFKNSRLGLRLRAARDEVVAAQAVGVDVRRDRQLALIYSAFWMGAGGCLYAQFLGAFSPNTFFLELTFLTLAMLVIGGMRSVSGAVLGVILVSTLQLLLRTAETAADRPGMSAVVLGVLMLITLILRPGGVTAGKEIVVPLRRRKDNRPTDSSDAESLARTPASTSLT